MAKAPKETEAQAMVLLRQCQGLLDELWREKLIGQTLESWETRRRLGGNPNPAPVSYLRQALAAFLES